jgi:hypothetical protein
MAADLIVYAPKHGLDNNDIVFISWLGANFFVIEKTVDTFKFSASLAGSAIGYTQTISEGYIRQVSDAQLVIDGLYHLEGETVKIVSGTDIQTGTVSNGSVTIANAVYPPYRVGQPYTMKVRTMRLSIPESPTIQGRIKRINETTVRQLRSGNGQAGQEYDGVEYLTDLDTSFSDTASDVKVLTKGGFNTVSLCSVIVSYEIEETR